MTEAPTTTPASTGIAGVQKPALVLGVLGLAASAVGWLLSPAAFYKAWLPSYVFWFQIAVGALAILLLQYVTGGEWGLLIRRPLGAAARTMIWMAFLFVPIAIGLPHIYPWADHHAVEHDPVLRLKEPYLNTRAFLIRTAMYFALWILWAWRVRVLSLRFYEDRSPYTELSRRKWAASGLLMIVMTLTFTGIDWLMTLEPTWMSSMYGINFLVGAGLAAFAFVTFFLTRIAGTPAMAGVLKSSHLRDLGNLMLAFVMLWAYTAFSEFMLIWYGNIKEETPHFLVRQHGIWGVMAALLIVFHFFLPFFMLLMRAIKDRPATIGVVAIIVLVMRYVHIYWLAAPSLYGEHFHLSWIGVASFVGIGGLWLYFFIGQLKGQTIIPIHESWVDEALREGTLKAHA
ncbi:MAG TPA: hypothetical protein VNL91_11200 [Thermoanaerobaculia bacterium]|nr:hypothetical protein [Thermoanaerobaculia bacterium]